MRYKCCCPLCAAQEMYDSWPFFKGLLDLVEMVMAKADPRVTRMYDTKLVRPELQVGTPSFFGHSTSIRAWS